ncbi:uncharacterized protein LOC134815477 [Bolinopsis microptera]|uniref:uncharacterized protein LOC134815477 n=1 Tax=Bolinopsis microptera TaxID=2820187 RepID=UPI003078D34E
MTALVAEISEMKSASHVLDLGCGQGIPVMDIAVHIGCSVVGVDLAECHIENANKSAEFYKKEKKPDLESEFYAASYFDLPEAVTNQTFTHVMMQTSMFYAHHRIDEILSTIFKLLRPGGVLVTTDVLRTGESADLNKFMKMNFMSALLTLDEMKAALLRNGLEYYGGENLDDHFIKSAAKKTEKIVTENIPCPSLPFFKLQESIVKNKEMTFQIVMAKKI